MKKLFQYFGTFAFIFLVYFLGELNGILEGNLVGEFLSNNFAPNKTIDPTRYTFLLSIATLWMMCFCIINLKYYSSSSRIQTAQLGKCCKVSIFCTLLYFALWPGIAGRRIPLSYNEWPVDFNSFLYQEDGVFESLTAILLLFAFIHFIRAGKISTKSFQGQRTSLTLFLLGTFSFIFMMEEISWGQRIFSWESPQFISELNDQNETNLHNIFNPLIADGERLFSIFISLVLLTAVLYKNRIQSPAIRSLFPSNKFYFIPVYFFVSGMASSELFEEIFAVFLFFYSKEIWSYYSNKFATREPLPINENFRLAGC